MSESENQHELFHKMMFLMEQLNEPKYMAGGEEHGGLITDMSEEELELAELYEILDLVNYRLAKIMKRKGLV